MAGSFTVCFSICSVTFELKQKKKFTLSKLAQENSWHVFVHSSQKNVVFASNLFYTPSFRHMSEHTVDYSGILQE